MTECSHDTTRQPLTGHCNGCRKHRREVFDLKECIKELETGWNKAVDDWKHERETNHMLQAKLDAVAKLPQKIRYYKKHQNLRAWVDMEEYEKGVSVTCDNLEKLITDELQAKLEKR